MFVGTITAFYMVGNIKDVQEKATKMAKSLDAGKKTAAAATAAAAQYSLNGQVELITKGFEQYGLKLDKSKDQLKEEIEPWLVPPVIIQVSVIIHHMDLIRLTPSHNNTMVKQPRIIEQGFANVPSSSSDLPEAEIKDKFKEAFNSLTAEQKAEAKEYASKFNSKDWKKFIDPQGELKGEADVDDWPWNEPGDLPEEYL